jgi:hypothetical protein
MAAEGQAIKTVFITMFFSLDCFIPAKILGSQTFVILVHSADSCKWLSPVCGCILSHRGKVIPMQTMKEYRRMEV